MTNDLDYLSVLQNLLEGSKKPFSYKAVQQIEAHTASLYYQVREILDDGAMALMGVIMIAADEQLLYRANSKATYDFLRLKLEGLGLSCHE